MDLTELKRQVLETAEAVVRSGAISMSGHGNISIRVPGRDEMVYTAGGSLNGLTPGGIARLRLDGTLLEGELPPIAGAVIRMHTAIYLAQDDAGCVIHTHSPFATAFAVANRPIECWTEAFGIFGLEDGVPVAAYGPRGSDQAVDNIMAALTPTTRGVLLANHGVLAFHRTPAETVQVGVVIEEAAQAAVYAGAVGGARAIAPEMLLASRHRAETFAAEGTRAAG